MGSFFDVFLNITMQTMQSAVYAEDLLRGQGGQEKEIFKQRMFSFFVSQWFSQDCLAKESKMPRHSINC